MVAASGNASAGTFQTTGVPSGSYNVELTANGCVFSSPAQTFSQDPPVDIQFNTANICNGTITAVTTPVATTYNWSASQSGSLTNPGNGATVTVNPGTWMLRVTTDAPGGSCPGSDSTTVTIDNYTPAFTQSDACQDQVTLTATPAGAYTYRWFRNNVQIPGGRVITTSAADDNVAYFVRVVSTLERLY